MRISDAERLHANDVGIDFDRAVVNIRINRVASFREAVTSLDLACAIRLNPSDRSGSKRSAAVDRAAPLAISIRRSFFHQVAAETSSAQASASVARLQAPAATM